MTEQIYEASPENIPVLVKMALDFWGWVQRGQSGGLFYQEDPITK